MKLPDYSEWLTPERLAVEEKAWEEAKFEDDYLKPLVVLLLQIDCHS